jgi:ATP-binding cassette subfamily B protein IrtA
MKLLLNLIKDKKISMIICVSLAALGSILFIVPFALIFKIVEHYLRFGPDASAGPVLQWLGIAFGALLLRYVLIVSAFVFSHIAAFDLLYRIRARLTKHIGTLPMGFWSKKSSGQVLKIVQDDVEAIESFVAHYLPDVASAVMIPLVTLAYLFAVDWRLAVAASIPLPLTIILVYMMWNGLLTGQNRKELARKYHQAIEKMHVTMHEFVQGMPVVKAFNLTVDSFQKLKDSVLAYGELVVTWSKGVSPYRALIAAVVLGGGLFILPLGIYLLESGKVDVSTIILFLLLGTGCFTELLKVIIVVTRMELIIAGIKRIQEILSAQPLAEPEIPKIPERFGIEFQKVSFRYTEQGPNILNDITINLPEGSFTALVGPSGAGKTTLINLIARMWEVADGSITIGGVPLWKMGTKGIAAIVGTVFQDVQMLTDTVKANIRMGRADASQETVEAAAKAAACHDFIMKLPHGYDTVIGDGGEVHLSGGEKQRIALARVFLKNPPVILLDEATSYADAENETLMQEAFGRLMVNKTVVVIAHRLSTIVGADQIFVVDQGRVVEHGTHQELLALTGVYQKMWGAHTRAREWRLAQKEASA